MMSVEQSVEWELAGETELLGENLLQRHFVHHKSHMTSDRTRAAGVGSRQLTAWATARSSVKFISVSLQLWTATYSGPRSQPCPVFISNNVIASSNPTYDMHVCLDSSSFYVVLAAGRSPSKDKNIWISNRIFWTL
jgi:hypothetical protein